MGRPCLWGVVVDFRGNRPEQVPLRIEHGLLFESSIEQYLRRSTDLQGVMGVVSTAGGEVYLISKPYVFRTFHRIFRIIRGFIVSDFQVQPTTRVEIGDAFLFGHRYRVFVFTNGEYGILFVVHVRVCSRSHTRLLPVTFRFRNPWG